MIEKIPPSIEMMARVCRSLTLSHVRHYSCGQLYWTWAGVRPRTLWFGWEQGRWPGYRQYQILSHVISRCSSTRNQALWHFCWDCWGRKARYLFLIEELSAGNENLSKAHLFVPARSSVVTTSPMGVQCQDSGLNPGAGSPGRSWGGSSEIISSLLPC